MKLKDAQQYYSSHSTKASEVSRQLCFAGIAVIWILATKNGSSKAVFSLGMLLPLSLYVIALSLDLLHYIFASYMWGRWAREQEKENSDPEREMLAPRWINWPALFCFWCKLLATIIGYCFLVVTMMKEVTVAL